jgi:hypothetical protein
MAEKVGEFPDVIGRGRPYPWNEWLDGGIWKLIQGEDFAASMSNFRALVYMKAQDRQLQVRTRVVADAFYLQAEPRVLISPVLEESTP